MILRIFLFAAVGTALYIPAASAKLGASLWSKDGCMKDYTGVPAFKKTKASVEEAYLQLIQAIASVEITHNRCAQMGEDSSYNDSNALQGFIKASDKSSNEAIRAKQSAALALKSLSSFEEAITTIGSTKSCLSELSQNKNTLDGLSQEMEMKLQKMIQCTSGAPISESTGGGQAQNPKKGKVEYETGITPKKGKVEYENGITPKKGKTQYSY